MCMFRKFALGATISLPNGRRSRARSGDGRSGGSSDDELGDGGAPLEDLPHSEALRSELLDVCKTLAAQVDGMRAPL